MYFTSSSKDYLSWDYEIQITGCSSNNAVTVVFVKFVGNAFHRTVHLANRKRNFFWYTVKKNGIWNPTPTSLYTSNLENTKYIFTHFLKNEHFFKASKWFLYFKYSASNYFKPIDNFSMKFKLYFMVKIPFNCAFTKSKL